MTVILFPHLDLLRILYHDAFGSDALSHDRMLHGDHKDDCITTNSTQACDILIWLLIHDNLIM